MNRNKANPVFVDIEAIPGAMVIQSPGEAEPRVVSFDSKTTTDASENEFSDGAFEMLKAGVNMARFERFRSLETLVKELHARFPGRSNDIDAAVAFWKRNPPSLLPEDFRQRR